MIPPIPLTPEQQARAAAAYPELRRRRIIDRDGRGVFGLLEAAGKWDGKWSFAGYASWICSRRKRGELRNERQSRRRHPIHAGPLLRDFPAAESETIEARDLAETLKLKCPADADLLLAAIEPGGKAEIARRDGVTRGAVTHRVKHAFARVRKVICIAALLAVLLPTSAHAALKWIDLTASPDWNTRTGTYTPTVWLDDGSGFPGLLADDQQTADAMMELGAVSVVAATQPSLDATAPTFARGDDTLTISSLLLLDSTATYDGLFPIDLRLDHPEIIDRPITLTSAGNPDVTYTLTNADVPEPGPVLLWLGIAFAWACRDSRRWTRM